MPLLADAYDGHDLYYKWNPVTNETATGLTVLFIHGLGSSHSFYDPVVRSLKQRGYSCLSFDTPGSAGSKHSGVDKTPKELAKVASDLLSALVIPAGNVVVVGHSMGAMVASELALLLPLRGVVLLGPVHPTPSLAKIFDDRIQKVQKEGLDALADTIPDAATGPRATPTEKAFIRALILSQTSEGYISLCQTIAKASPPKYTKAQCPLFVIAGGHDKTSPLENSRTILDQWGNGQQWKDLFIIEDIGHWHCVEAPGEIGNSIAFFLSKLNR